MQTAFLPVGSTDEPQEGLCGACKKLTESEGIHTVLVKGGDTAALAHANGGIHAVHGLPHPKSEAFQAVTVYLQQCVSIFVGLAAEHGTVQFFRVRDGFFQHFLHPGSVEPAETAYAFVSIVFKGEIVIEKDQIRL